jgi:hypothetical protein
MEGRKGTSKLAKVALLAAWRSDSLTFLRQAKVSFGEAPVHACVLLTKNAQAGKLRLG